MTDCPSLTVAQWEADYEARIARKQARVAAGLAAAASEEREKCRARRAARLAAQGEDGVPRRFGKPVVCVETGQTFRRIRDAAEFAGVKRSTFREALRKGRPCGGYTWRRLPWKRRYRVKTPWQSGKGERPVRCVETGREWPSCRAAAREMGVHIGTFHKSILYGWACHRMHFEFVKRPESGRREEAA